MDHLSETKISVAICTFNGEQFLEEQLKSIAIQSLPPSELIISDDNSTDSTLSIIEKFSAEATFPIRIIRNNKQLGVTANFSQALSNCSGDYVALCDQDDIWQPGKLEADYLNIRKTETAFGKNTPVLIHSDPVPVDTAGVPIADSFMKIRRIYHLDEEPLRRLLVQNFVTGCTVMVNRILLDIALPIPPAAVIHDWWLALTAAATGSITFNKHQSVFYRQHHQNVIGATPYYSLENLKRLFSFKELEKEFAESLKQANCLLQRLKSIKSYEAPAYLQDYLTVAEIGGLKAVSFVINQKIIKAGWQLTMIQLLMFADKGYRRFM